jgi:hypothetical protein
VHVHTVMGEQGEQKWAENTPLWGPRVEDQCSGGVVCLPSPTGVGLSGSPGSICIGVQTQGPELRGHYVVEG